MDAKKYRSPVVEALYTKYGKEAMECSPKPQPIEQELGMPKKGNDETFIPRGWAPKLFSIALVAFAVMFTIGITIGMAVNNNSGDAYAGTGGGAGAGEGGGISVTVLVFSIIAAFSLGGFLVSVFLGGGFDRFRRKEAK